MDAHSGEVVVANEIVEQTATARLQYAEDNPNSVIEVEITRDGEKNNIYRFYDEKNKILVGNMEKHEIPAIIAFPRKLELLNKTVATEYVLVLPESKNWINQNDFTQRQAFYAIYSMVQVKNIYQSVLRFEPGLKELKVAINLNKPNAMYCQDGSFFKFGYSDSENQKKLETVNRIDLVGHEYTHLYQDYCITNSRYYKGEYSLPDFGYSLGSGFGEKISGNIKWVETEAISEGTADIMGMLMEALNGEVIFNSDRFWCFGEYGADISVVDNMTKNHLEWAVNVRQGDDQHHTTVAEMKEYWNAHKNVEYGDGPGHFDRYILPHAFSLMIQDVAQEGLVLDETDWFKIWGEAIKLLTPSSTFADMRLALIQSAESQGYRSAVDSIKWGLKEVGITDAHHADKNIWYMPYVNRAVEDGILTADINNGFNYDQPMTRGELLTLAMKYAEIQGVSDNHKSNRNWAYSYGILNDKWRDDSYLNETIARWEAARVIAGVLNQAKGKKKISYKPLYGADKNFDDFQKEMFKDWGASIAPDDSAIINLLNLNTDYSDYVYPKITKVSEIEERYSKFCTEHNWSEPLYNPEAGKKGKPKYNPKTANMLYYFGMYQLWQNGKFGGQSINGEKYLKSTDQILCGEVCAILYKK